ncbi:DUF3618 domain-containing protein [Marinivivus vitaminiproducens]|uniref:DUF3618 domain-containing protein n=1 Tax=Marinivivus vitaminiproducens TaxID=3035935 RepID=UPI0027A6ADBE|nr:DUF3618 domain-containing protein [Geminicoccaceae bacterium SCSIO 64248]
MSAWAGHTSSAQIEREIEETRAALSGTVDRIQERLSPGRIVGDLSSYVRDNGSTQFMRNLGLQVRDNPLPVALVGAGLAWLMVSSRIGSGDAGHAQAKAHDAMDAAHHRGDRAREGVSSLRDDTARTGERGMQASRHIVSMVEDHPVVLGAVGLAIGAVLESILPRSQAEDRVLGPAADAMKGEVRGAAAQAMDAATKTSAPQEPSGREGGEPNVHPAARGEAQERDRNADRVDPTERRAEAAPPTPADLARPGATVGP